MTTAKLSFALLAASAALGLAACGTKTDAPATEEAAPTAKVKTAAIRRDVVVETVEGYGVAGGAPGAVRAANVPFEARVRRILVAEGAAVSAGAALVELEPSADTRLAVAQARDEAVAASEQKGTLSERLGMRLSTKQDVQQAEQRERAAAIRERDLASRGATGPRVLRAETSGVVARVDAQAGQVVAAGAPLVELVGGGDVAVRVGIEPSDAPRVRRGAPVRLEAVDDPSASAIEGRVDAVAEAVNPQTRLVDVFVVAAARPRLNAYYRARIEVGRRTGLVVPRAAVLPDDDRSVLFVLERGKAARRVVQVGADDGTVVEVAGAGVAAGDRAVVEGNAELEDGMAATEETSR